MFSLYVQDSIPRVLLRFRVRRDLGEDIVHLLRRLFVALAEEAKQVKDVGLEEGEGEGEGEGDGEGGGERGRGRRLASHECMTTYNKHMQVTCT